MTSIRNKIYKSCFAIDTGGVTFLAASTAGTSAPTLAEERPQITSISLVASSGNILKAIRTASQGRKQLNQTPRMHSHPLSLLDNSLALLRPRERFLLF